MQEQVRLPEHGWSKLNRVVDGYGINRHFMPGTEVSTELVVLPSRSEVNRFVLEYEGTDFTRKELGDFITSDLMSGVFFDINLRSEPTPDIISLASARVESLTPADIIDSWLRNPEAWSKEHITPFPLQNGEGGWKDATYSVDKGTPFDLFVTSGAETFADIIYPSSVLSIARVSLLMRRSSIGSAIFPMLDMHRVPLSAITNAVNSMYGGMYNDAFESLAQWWVRDCYDMASNLEILQSEGGVLRDPRTAEWVFVMAEHSLNKETAEKFLNAGIGHEKLVPYLNRSVSPSDAFTFIENEIDTSLAESISSSY